MDAATASVFVAGFAAIGTIVTGVLSYLNSRTLNEVKKNTDGLMTARVQAEGDKQIEVGKAIGVEAERVRADS